MEEETSDATGRGRAMGGGGDGDGDGDNDASIAGPSFNLRAMIDDALSKAKAGAAAAEKARRADPEWSKFYEFQSWLDMAIDMAREEFGPNEEGESEDEETHRDDEGADATEEPSLKKAKSGGVDWGRLGEKDDDKCEGYHSDSELHMEGQLPPDLETLHDNNDLDEAANIQRQIDIIGPFLFGKDQMAAAGYPPELFWRALWSTEAAHDAHFGEYRLRHFHRWDREEVAPDDPWRDGDLCNKALYFPGKLASHDAKCAWAGVVVEESAGNDMRPAFDVSWPRDGVPALDEVGDVISSILIACAPEKLSVCLYIERKMIDSFLAPVVIQEEEKERISLSFSTGATNAEWEDYRRKAELNRHQPGIDSVVKFLSSPYLRDDFPNAKIPISASDEFLAEQLGTFKEWLKNSPVVGSLHQEPVLAKLPPKRYDKLTAGMNKRSRLEKKGTENDLVLLARCENVPREADTEKVLADMVEQLGLNDEIVGIRASCGRNPEIHGYAYITRDNVGGNIHYPDGNNEISVAFTWTSTEKFTEEHMKRRQFRQAFETDFVRRARARKEASNGRLHFLLWPKVPSNERDGYFSREEPTAVTSANAHIIWLRGDYASIEDEAFDLFINGGAGKSAAGLRFTSTHDGNLFWESVTRYFRNFVVNGWDQGLLDEDSEDEDGDKQYKTISNAHCLKMYHLLAITRSFIEAEDLMFDHEYPEEEIQEFFDKFGREWRRVLRQSDETLGFGLRESSTHAKALVSKEIGQMKEMRALSEQTPAHSREGLCALLKFHGSWIEEELNDRRNDIDFNVSLVQGNDEQDDDVDEEDDEDDDEQGSDGDDGEDDEDEDGSN